MNIFNRIAMIVSLMVLIVILAVVVISVLFFPVQVVEWAQQGANVLEDNLVPANRLMNRLTVFGVGALLLILSTLLLWLEIRRGRAKTIRVQRISGGEARLAIESISRRVEHNIKELPDVVAAKPTVIRRGKGVEILLDLETSPDIEVPMKTEEVCVVTREVVEDQMGLKLNNVKVKIRHTPFPKEKRRPWDWQRRELPRPVDLPVGEPEEVVPVYAPPVAEVADVEEVSPPPTPPEEEFEEIIEGELEEAPPAPPFPEERLDEPEEMAAEEEPSLSPFAKLKGLFVKETPAPEEAWFEPVPPYEQVDIEEVVVTPPPPVPEFPEMEVEEAWEEVSPPPVSEVEVEEVELEMEEVSPPPIPEMEEEEPLEEVEVTEEFLPYGPEVEQEVTEEEAITPTEEAEETPPLEEEAAEPEEEEPWL